MILTHDTIIEYANHVTNSAYGTISGKRFSLYLVKDDWYFLVGEMTTPDFTLLHGPKSSRSANLEITDFLVSLIDCYKAGPPYPAWIIEGEPA
jgi:hypothetical protein